MRLGLCGISTCGLNGLRKGDEHPVCVSVRVWYPLSFTPKVSHEISGDCSSCTFAGHHHHTSQPFYGPFSGTTRVSRCQKRNFWSLWCKERLTEADTSTIRLGTTPSGLTSAHFHHPPIFFTGRMPFLPPNQQCQSTEGN